MAIIPLRGQSNHMEDDTLALAKSAFRSGNFAEAYRLVESATPKDKASRAERDCLLSECLQYVGDFQQALRIAETAIGESTSAEHLARYWEVVGRVRLNQLRREEA